MAKAIWQGTVIAESDELEIVEGNVYFPPGAIKAEFFEASEHGSVCPWKGNASYCHVVIDGERNENAAWFYPTRRRPRPTSKTTSPSGTV